MQVTSTQLNIKTKRDDSGELSRFFVLLGVLLFFFTSCTTTKQLNNFSSPLEIKTADNATGTGFMFSSSDYVITSYHVVHGSKSISVRLTNGERIDATIAVKDTNNDIAILKLSKPPTSRQNIITLGDSTSVKTGDRVFTYGFPLVDLLGNQEPRYSEGFVNSLSGMSNDPRLFQVSIPIQPGNSGGPIFNEKGELIGIATSSIDSIQTQKVFGATPQNVNFAIKSSYINSLLPNLPDTFIKQRGIVPVPIEQSSFKERVKNDIVLVEAVPEFQPTVVKRDYEEEERLRKEQDVLQRERELEQREQELNRREAQQNNNWEERNRRDQRGTQDNVGLIPCDVGCGPGTDTYEKHKQIVRDLERRNSRDIGGCVVENGMGGCDIGISRQRNRKPKGNFNFNFRFGK
jgi:S1-C subfamily serine protease